MKTLACFIDNPNLIAEALERTKIKYRPHDPGWYLYRQVLKTEHVPEKFVGDFIELVYVTLAAWNMNSRGAKLAEWYSFKESILEHKEDFIRLERYRLDSLTDTDMDWILEKEVPKMFFEMNLVGANKPRLVTYSKVLHFFLPDLFVPIDRKYTLAYFYGNTNVPQDLNGQIERFCELFREFRKFASSAQLADKKDDVWNSNVPKIIDNMIIGFQKNR
jgi:hypothetical protein